MSTSNAPSVIAERLAAKLVPLRCDGADAFVQFERDQYRQEITKSLMPTQAAADKFAAMNRRERVSFVWHLVEEARHMAAFQAFESMVPGYVRMRFHELLGLPLTYDPGADTKPVKKPIDISKL